MYNVHYPLSKHIFFGFLNGKVNGYPGGGSGNQANQVYLSVPGLFSNPGSVDGNNATYNAKVNCPENKYDETEAICEDPQLTDETWHVYGYGNMAPISGSRVIGMGTAISGVTVDYAGNTRPDPPSIGALEYGSSLSKTQITIEAAPNPAELNQPVILKASVAQTGSAVPTGSIDFMNGNGTLGQGTLDNTGEATLVVSTLPVGSYAVVAAYSGNSNYPSGESGVVPLQVLSATTTSLIASPNPVTAGQAVTLTATVQGSGNTAPTGRVSFLNGSAPLGTANLNASGVATLSTTSLAAGNYSLTAQYPGSTGFLSSTSAPVSITVKALSTATFSPGTGIYSRTQTVTIAASKGAVICYNSTGSPATNGTTGCTRGTLYTGPVSVSSSETLYAVAGGTGYPDSSVGSAAYTIGAGTPLLVGTPACFHSGGSAIEASYTPYAAGDGLLISWVIDSPTFALSSVTDNGSSGGSSYTILSGQTGQHGPARSLQIAYTKSLASKVTRITITPNSTTVSSIACVQEFSNVSAVKNLAGTAVLGSGTYSQGCTLADSTDYLFPRWRRLLLGHGIQNQQRNHYFQYVLQQLWQLVYLGTVHQRLPSDRSN